MAKVFFTVVGAGKYKPTKYRLYNDICENRFVQKSLLTLLKNSGEEFDRIVFFLTEKAKEDNWEKYIRYENLSNGERVTVTDEGLEEFLEKNFQGKYKAVDICDGQGEIEQLELFKTMYNAINEGDEIVFDITHGFRSIPLLFFPLISYAKELKNIKINNIFYGLLNNDGDISDIIDLKAYEEILNCANAAHNFRCSGNTGEMAELIERIKNKNMVEKATAENESMDMIRSDNISRILKRLTYALLTCQGGTSKNSIGNQLKILNRDKEKISGENFVQAEIFNNMINHAIDSFDEMNEADASYKLGMSAVKWYMERGLYMQAYTALRESITTFFCEKYGKGFKVDDNKFRERAVDRAITSAIRRNSNESVSVENCMLGAFRLYNDKELAADKREQYAVIFTKIVNHIDFEKIAYVNLITEMRNKMDHFGMNSNELKVNKAIVKEHYDNTLALFDDIESRHDSIMSDEEALELLKNFGKGGGVFVNFSNHPSANWSAEQLEAAKEISGGGDIVDVPFPAVSADATEEEISEIAGEYAEKIVGMNPSAVMCMGEFGVCFKVLKYLQEKGIRTVYSCSERKAVEVVTDKGIEKNSVFNFVKFREYNK